MCDRIQKPSDIEELWHLNANISHHLFVVFEEVVLQYSPLDADTNPIIDDFEDFIDSSDESGDE